MYSYLRHRGVEIGPYEKTARTRSGAADQPFAGSDDTDMTKTGTIFLSLRIENNSKFVRGKKRAKEDTEYSGPWKSDSGLSCAPS